LTYCRKFSTVFGAFAASSSITMSPIVVTSLTFCARAGALRPRHRTRAANTRAARDENK